MDSNKKASHPSRLQVRQEIKKLNRLSPERALYPSIVSTYEFMISGLAIVVGKAGGGELFHRVRRTSGHKPSLLSELQAPPVKFVTGYQRCNPPGVSMFYAASRRIGALLEARVEAGEIVYLSEWIGREQIPVNRIFDTEENQAMPNTDMSTIQGPNDDLIVSFFDTLFTRRIHSTFSDEYKFTSAIAQRLNTNFTPDNFHDIRKDRFVALKYPSVFKIDDCHNTAMQAAFAAERLDLIHVMELNILSVKDNEVTVEILDNAYEFKDEKIIWSGNPNAVPTILDKDRSVPFVYDGTKWKLELHTGLVDEDYVRRLVAD